MQICGSVLAREDHDQHLNRCAWGGSASGRVMEVQARAFHGVMRLTMIAGPEATLADLDASIRGTWMEPCCMERHGESFAQRRRHKPHTRPSCQLYRSILAVSTIGLRDKTVQDQQCEFVSPTAGDAWDAPVTVRSSSSAHYAQLLNRLDSPRETAARYVGRR